MVKKASEKFEKLVAAIQRGNKSEAVKKVSF